ncbi:hypothetical protein [Pseudomonas sp. TE3610]
MYDNVTQDPTEGLPPELQELLDNVNSIDLTTLEIAEIEIDSGVRMTTHRS